MSIFRFLKKQTPPSHSPNTEPPSAFGNIPPLERDAAVDPSSKRYSELVEAVRAWLANGGDPNIPLTRTSYIEQRLIHRAASRGANEIVKLLLEHGTPVDVLDGAGSTPLLLVCRDDLPRSRGKSVPVIQLLLDRGANPRVTNMHGQCAISMAEASGVLDQIPALRALLAAHDTCESSSSGGQTEHSNIRRWAESKHCERWFFEHCNGWNHDDWLSLISDLARTDFWPMREDEIGRTIEELKRQRDRFYADQDEQLEIQRHERRARGELVLAEEHELFQLLRAESAWLLGHPGEVIGNCPQSMRIQEIGRAVFQLGGIELMRRTALIVSQCERPLARKLEFEWDGIGGWKA